MTNLPKKLFVTRLEPGRWSCNNEILPGEPNAEGLGASVSAALGHWLIKNQTRLAIQVHERDPTDSPLSRKSKRRIKSTDVGEPTFKEAILAWVTAEMTKLRGPLAVPNTETGIDYVRAEYARAEQRGRLQAFEDLLNAPAPAPQSQ